VQQRLEGAGPDEFGLRFSEQIKQHGVADEAAGLFAQQRGDAGRCDRRIGSRQAATDPLGE
jgi:hypothetical protein